MSEWWNNLDILGKFLFGALFASLGIQFVLIVCLFVCMEGCNESN